MLEFIKMFGLGIFYTLISPILLVVLAIFLAYTLISYLVFEVINLGGFFFGVRIKKETKLDEELLKRKQEDKAKEESISKDGDLDA